MKKLVIAALAAGSLAACGGGNPVTQYVVNYDSQLAITKGQNANCGDADPQAHTFTTNEKSGDVLSLYTTADGTSYADLGGFTFSGKKNGDAYTLTDTQSAEDRTVQNRDYIQSDVWTLSVTINGSYASGSVQHEHHESCSGNSCSQSEANTIDCLYATNLRGEKLPDDGSQAGLPTP